MRRHPTGSFWASSRFPSIAALVGLAAALAVALAAGGCSDDEKSTPPPPSPYLEPSSPANVLANLQTAYLERDAAAYAELFSEDFVFSFDPSLPEAPARWTRQREIEHAEDLFADPAVTAIEISLEPAAPETLIDVIPGVPVCVRLRVPDTRLRATWIDPTNHETWIFEADGTTQNYYFKEGTGDEAQTYPGGGKRWYCFRWDEDPLRTKVKDMTWGELKLRFWDPAHAYAQPSSPEELLENLRTAYTSLDASQYAETFSQDFFFIFADADAESAEDPTLPEWDRAAEKDAARRMFQDATVRSVNLAWTPGPSEPAEAEFPEHPGCRKVRVNDVQLRVETVRHGEMFTYLVSGAVHDFYFREGTGAEGQTYPDQRKRWYCFFWKDLSVGGKTEETTWGRIKTHFAPPPDYFPPNSPRAVLANLRQAYEKRNPLEYGELFSQDFVFSFSPVDVNDPHNPTPPEWPRADELLSATNMLMSERVDGIELSWGGSDAQAEPAADRFPQFPECLKVQCNSVHLRVTTHKEDGEVWIYLVTGQRQDFYFKEGRGPEAETYPSGRKRWYCFCWEDSPLGGKGKPDSWGQIKALFR